MSLVTRLSLIGILLLGGCSSRTSTLRPGAPAPSERRLELRVFAVPAESELNLGLAMSPSWATMKQAPSQAVMPKGTKELIVWAQLLAGKKRDRLSYSLIHTNAVVGTATVARVESGKLWAVRKGDIMTDGFNVFQNAMEDTPFGSSPLSVSVAEGSEDVYIVFNVKPAEMMFADGSYTLEVLYNDSLSASVSFIIGSR